MEHLMIAAGGSLDKIDVVPYVAKKDYIGRSFLQYVDDKITPGEDILWANNTPKAEIDSFFQTALFFCLFQDVLGSHFVPEEFIKDAVADDGVVRQILCTEKLESAILEWEKFARGNSKFLRREQEHLAIFERASKFAWLFESGMVARSVALSVLTSILLIAEAVSRTFQYGSTDADTQGTIVRNKMSAYSLAQLGSSNRPLKEDVQVMVKNGWCPRDADRVWGTFLRRESQMMLRTMPKPAIENHADCTIDRCENTQIDRSTFSIKHVTSDCQCKLWEVDGPALISIIESGKLPLLVARSPSSSQSFSAESFDELGLRLVASEGDIKYVAISHVWKDGLANPFSNALPSCQLYALLGILAEFTDSQDPKFADYEGHFWIDPICCPLGSPASKAKVLSSMAKIYAESHVCLVLDAGLKATCCTELGPIDIGMRILSSSWMQRGWTLQEAQLPQSLYFRFADGTLSMNSLLLDLYQLGLTRPDRLVGRSVHVDVSSMLWGLCRKGAIPDDSSCLNLRSVKNSIARRSLSVARDEAICLLTLIGEQLPSIEMKEGEGMARFWTAVVRRKSVQARIVFYSSPKLKLKGFQWAPRSFLLDNNQCYLDYFLYGHPDENAVATLSDKGLHVNFRGYLLERPKMPAQQQFDRHDNHEGPWIPLILVHERTRKRWWGLHHRWVPFADQKLSIDDGPELAIVLANDGASDGSRSAETGIIASIVERTETNIRVHHEGYCNLTEGIPDYGELCDALIASPVNVDESVSSELKELAVRSMRKMGFKLTDVGQGDEDLPARLVKATSRRLELGHYFSIQETLPTDQAWIVD